MPDVLVRNVDEAVIDRLKKRAQQRHRSLQAELQTILERAAAQIDAREVQALAKRLRRKLARRAHTDSTQILADDRSR